MVNETDKDMQQLYHRNCGFCREFCGNEWCPIYEEVINEYRRLHEICEGKLDGGSDKG